jgi:drug/metabolite transporter (DMT)-like permease
MTLRSANAIGFTAILLWSLLALFTAASGTMPPFQLAAVTFLIGGLCGSVVLLARGTRIGILRQPGRVWLLGVGGLFGYHALYFAALRTAPPAEAGLICYLWPLLIVLFSGLLPGERLRGMTVAGAMLGFMGVIVLVAGRGRIDVRAEYALGYICAGAAAFVWAAYSVLSRRFGQVPTDAVAGFCLATSLLSLVCHMLFETTLWPSHRLEWLAVLALGIGPVGAAFYAWDIGMKRGDIRLLGVASYAAPVLSTLALVLAGYAEPTTSLALACVLIVSGALLATFAGRCIRA